MHPARSRLTVFSAAVIVAVAAVLAVLLPTGIASAQTRSAAGTRVGAHDSGMILAVRFSQAVSAGGGRCEASPQAGFASGLCVAPEDTADLAGATCGGMSFAGKTKVLAASGALVAISELKTGQKVLATNTKTGKTQAEAVTAVLVHHDTDKYDLKVKIADGGTTVIQTTSSHLFFDQDTRRWVKAGALRYGTHLRTSDGSTATVTGGTTPEDASGWMWDLTIPGDHDFYVSAGGIGILAHNCGPVLLGTKADIENYIASKPGGGFDADFLNIRGTMAGGKGGVGGWTWTRNKAFIDDALNAGREVRLVTDPNPSLPAPAGGWPYAGGNTYARELNYLLGKGYGWQPVGDYWQVTRVRP